MPSAVTGFDSGQQGTFGQQERTLIAADGERVDTLFRASPRVDDDDVIGTIGLYVDITERKRRERTLERLHDATRDLLRAETRTAVAETITEGVRDVLGYPTNLVRFVEDDGPGLPDDGRDVFDSGYTTGADGTGLGLAIVERIAREHGWSVDAVAADDGGARFEFRR